MGERHSADTRETTLAAATAAIITARWAPRQPSDPYSPDAQGSTNGHTNGHAANGTGYGNGFSEWAPPTSPAVPAFDGGLPPVSPAPPVSPGPYGPEPAGSIPRPPEPAGSMPRPPEPAGSMPRPPEPAGSAFFSAVNPDPVPEVFAPYSEPVAPTRDFATGREEFRTHVPPGFERRNFGPFPEEPVAHRIEEPRVVVPEAPSALLGVLPPPVAAHPMPTSLAPPEPPAWNDAGWVDFPRDVEHEPGSTGSFSALAPGTATRLATDQQPLPKRTPRVPDFDMQLNADPAETAADPATQLNRIADYLRDDDAPVGLARPDPVDLEAVLGAVRQVPAVRDAQLRWNAQAGHTLRIEFADGVDESEVTRSVARLLRARLGLGAAPNTEEPTLDSPYRGRVAVAPRPRSGAGAEVVEGRPMPRPSTIDAPRLVVENVTVTRLGAEATVEVRLRRPGSGLSSVGEGRGPGVEAYLARLAATAAAHAVDQALAYGRGGKVFVEHVSVVPFGVVEVAVVVLLLSHDGVTERISGSAIIGDDPHLAVVRATLAALNRRLESLLS